MDTIIQGTIQAFLLITNLDRELLEIVFLSLGISGSALILAGLFAVPSGACLALRNFPGKALTVTLSNTLMGLPPVVVGLFLFLLLSRSGPLGFLGLLYTPAAMVAAQTILALPIILSLSHSAVVHVDPVIRQASLALGATPFQMTLAVLSEARYGIVSAVIAGFGRVTAEVGAILVVGGNIAGYTRVMTTAIALETDKGDFVLALALGIILLTISLVVNLALHWMQRSGQGGTGP